MMRSTAKLSKLWNYISLIGFSDPGSACKFKDQHIHTCRLMHTTNYKRLSSSLPTQQSKDTNSHKIIVCGHSTVERTIERMSYSHVCSLL
jgi:hypothetical protein